MKPMRLPLFAQEASRDGTVTLDAHGVNMVVEKDSNGLLWSYKRPGLIPYTWPVPYASTAPVCILPTQYGPLAFFVNGASGYVTDGTITATLPGSSYWFLRGGDTYTTVSAAAQPLFLFLYDTVVNGAETTLAYTYNGLAFTQLSYASGSPPVGLLRGVVQIDGTFYAANSAGGIYGSNINDPTNWSAGNLVYANATAGITLAIARQLAYLLVFKTTDVEVFYDAANAAGSPLSAIPANRIQYGCVSGDTVSVQDTNVFWLAVGTGGEYFVVQMQGLSPKRISTAAVERMLRNALSPSTVGSAQALTCKVMGHAFYLLGWGTSTVLAYDIGMQVWTVWEFPLPINRMSASNFKGTTATSWSGAGGTLFMLSDGQTYMLDQAQGFDQTSVGKSTIQWELVTPPLDGGTRNTKYLSRMDVLTDNTPTTDFQFRWSDNDQRSWSNWRNVPLGGTHPSITDLGSFRRRTFHFRHSGAQPLRLQACDLYVLEGNV